MIPDVLLRGIAHFHSYVRRDLQRREIPLSLTSSPWLFIKGELIFFRPSPFPSVTLLNWVLLLWIELWVLLLRLLFVRRILSESNSPTGKKRYWRTIGICGTKKTRGIRNRRKAGKGLNLISYEPKQTLKTSPFRTIGLMQLWVLDSED